MKKSINKLRRIYKKEFYQQQAASSLSSAREILPKILSIKKITSVIDVGCGVGTWLQAATELGCARCLGVEGAWASPLQIKNPRIRYRTADLEKKITVKKRFDLAISMEVAEHLSPGRANSFIKEICQLSDMVLFSAARPNQGGTNHIHEQPPSFWIKKFWQLGYFPFDVIRPVVAGNENVCPWYKNNSILYIRKSILKGDSSIFQLFNQYYYQNPSIKAELIKVSSALNVIFRLFRSEIEKNYYQKKIKLLLVLKRIISRCGVG